MSMKNKLISFSLILIILSFVLSTIIHQSSPPISDKLLKVSINNSMSGCFSINRQILGLPIEVLECYAKSRNLILLTIKQDSSENIHQDIDFSFSPSYNTTTDSDKLLIHKTYLSLLTHKKNTSELSGDSSKLVFPKNQKIRIARGITDTLLFNKLTQAGCTITFSLQDPFLDIIDLNDGTCDYLICIEEVANVGSGLIKTVRKLFDFPTPIHIYLKLESQKNILKRDFLSWFEEFKKQEQFKELTRLYSEPYIAPYIITQSMQHPDSGRISNFDNIIKEVCRDSGYDWRFISAITYNESKFNEYCISIRGAKGLMQIMPAVANSLGHDSLNIMNPKDNILLGTKILKRIEEILYISPNTSDRDRLSVILACYNGGIGHILDIRDIVRSKGGNPDKWSELVNVLRNEKPSANELRYGKFNGSETIAFVKNVLSTYDKYCKLVAENQPSTPE